MEKNGYSKKVSDTRYDHYNQDGTSNGYSEFRTTALGDKVWVHYDDYGNVTGESKNIKDFFGDDIVNHTDERGNFTGTSGTGKDMFGDNITIQKDSDGNVIGKTENKENFLQGKHRQHYSDNSNDETRYQSPPKGPYDLFGKIVVGIIAIGIIIYLVILGILLAVYNLSVILLLFSFFRRQWKNYLLPAAVLASIYTVADYYIIHIFSRSIVNNANFLESYITWMLYLNITAGIVAFILYVLPLFRQKNNAPTDDSDVSFAPHINNTTKYVSIALIIIMTLLGGYILYTKKYAPDLITESSSNYKFQPLIDDLTHECTSEIFRGIPIGSTLQDIKQYHHNKDENIELNPYNPNEYHDFKDFVFYPTKRNGFYNIDYVRYVFPYSLDENDPQSSTKVKSIPINISLSNIDTGEDKELATKLINEYQKIYGGLIEFNESSVHLVQSKIEIDIYFSPTSLVVGTRLPT